MTNRIPNLVGPIVKNNMSPAGSLLSVSEIQLIADINIGSASNIVIDYFSGSPHSAEYQSYTDNNNTYVLSEFTSNIETWDDALIRSGSFVTSGSNTEPITGSAIFPWTFPTTF